MDSADGRAEIQHRLVGHGEHDDSKYVNAELKASALGQDCLKISEDYLVEKGWASSEEIAQCHTEAKEEVDTTANKVRREPTPDPAEDDWRAMATDAFAEQFSET